MTKIFYLYLLLLTTSCALQSKHTPYGPQHRSIAEDLVVPRANQATNTTQPDAESNSKIAWKKNPCYNQSGKPFKKYFSFALDPAQNKILAKKSETSSAEVHQGKPRAGSIWQSVDQFIQEAGIQKACDNSQIADNNSDDEDSLVTQQNQSNKGKDAAPPKSHFAPPIQFSTDLYYGIIEDGFQSQAITAPGPFRLQLHKFLSSSHLQTSDKPDQIIETCSNTPEIDGVRCVSPRVYSYNEAREKMFGGIDLKKNEDNSYSVFDYYCQKWMGPEDFKGVTRNEKEMPGPGQIVHNKKMNVEHTWPQSKFSGAKGTFENLAQKTDFHHIFPTDTEVNRIRANFEFANVNNDSSAKRMKCEDSLLGSAIPVEGIPLPQGPFFEPPKNHKGNVARALFYFSTRYNGGMSALQEYYLRQWNEEDPVDEMEQQRNENIYKLSGVRNPFVDHPNWANRIDRFCRIRSQNDNLKNNEMIDCK